MNPQRLSSLLAGTLLLASMATLAAPEHRQLPERKQTTLGLYHGPKMNANFVKEVKALVEPTDTVLLICRSGDRSAKAVDLLAAAGFENVYTVTDGFEGDKVKDPGSVFDGKRMRNGWKNSAPWVYDIDPEKLILEEYASEHKQ